MATGTIPTAVQVNSRTPVDLHSATGGKAPVATDGDYFPSAGGVNRLMVYNPESDTLTVTVALSAVDGVTPTPKSFTVAQEKCVLVGPFPTSLYGDTPKVICSFAASGVLANVVLKAIRF